jgi:hypothetical protein
MRVAHLCRKRFYEGMLKAIPRPAHIPNTHSTSPYSGYEKDKSFEYGLAVDEKWGRKRTVSIQAREDH